MHDHPLEIEIPIIMENDEHLPRYATAGSAGADIRASLKEPYALAPGHSVLVPTGIRMAIPDGYEVQIRPRSGLALKHQITVLNTPGTIDADYRGEIGIILINHGKIEFIIKPGMPIAQMVLAPFHRANFIPSSDLTATQRGAGGFGHTGY